MIFIFTMMMIKIPAEIILIELKSSIESYNKDVISQVKIQAQDFL